MLAVKPRNRITIEACCAEDGFPKLPESLPVPGFEHQLLLNSEFADKRNRNEMAAQVKPTTKNVRVSDDNE
jgi:hypothetical protein